MSRVRRDIEVMADLLLGTAAGPLPDRVIAMIEGNLPSRGDGWRLAAARLVVGSNQGTLLQPRFGALDLFDLHNGAADAQDLAGVIEAAPGGHQWVISTGSTLDGRMLTGAHEITLLTGIDEAAVVACYALLKRLLIERPGPTPAVSLVLAGTKSLDAVDRLVRTACVRLGVELTVLGCLPTPEPSVQGWRRVELPEGGVSTVLATLVAAAGSRRPATGLSPEPMAPPLESSSNVQSGPPTGHVTPPPPHAHAQPPTPVDPQAPTERQASTEQSASTEHQAPTEQSASSEQQAPTWQQAYPGPQAQPGLPRPASMPTHDAQRPLPPELSALGVHCPVAPGVVFATDAQGDLHAIASAPLLADLVAALGWASQHAAMLPGQTAVQGHVLVGDVASAAALQGAPWAIHLVINGPEGPLVLPARTAPLSQGPSSGRVPGWPRETT